MASITDLRKTVLQIVNEVRGKLGIADAASLSADNNSKVLLQYLNDVIDYIANYANWQELQQELTVTASTSVFQYLVSTTASSAPIKNIEEVAFEGLIAPLRFVTTEDMRRWRRVSSSGQPRQWTIYGIDNDTTGNPYIQVYPVPGSAENNKTFNVLVYRKPKLYTTSDGAAIPPFSSRLLVSMLLALALLDESRGTQNIDYRTEMGKFDEMIGEEFNRYNGDSGGNTIFSIRRR